MWRRACLEGTLFRHVVGLKQKETRHFEVPLPISHRIKLEKEQICLTGPKEIAVVVVNRVEALKFRGKSRPPEGLIFRSPDTRANGSPFAKPRGPLSLFPDMRPFSVFLFSFSFFSPDEQLRLLWMDFEIHARTTLNP